VREAPVRPELVAAEEAARDALRAASPAVRGSRRLSGAQLAARRKGGLACREKYGPEFYVAIGRRGGRPRCRTIKEVRARRALEATEKKEDGRSPALRRLLGVRRRREQKVMA